MNLGDFSLKYRVNVIVLTVLFTVGGWWAYTKMGRLEDPEFTIKQAQVVTNYPGASAAEVEAQVTEIIEMAVQQLGQLDRVQSTSTAGRSVVEVIVRDNYNKKTLPQVWDELRRKVGDVQRQLPDGAGPSLVVDDFGDVYGIFFGLTGDGYTDQELRFLAEFLQRELLTVQDVAKIELIGVQREAVYVELSPTRMASSGISRDQIIQALRSKNLVADAGTATVGSNRLALRPSGVFNSAEEIGDLLIAGAGDGRAASLIYLRDIAQVVRGPVDPPAMQFRVDGAPAVGLAISTVAGGNVVTMGEALDRRLRELDHRGTIPFGVTFHRISIQSDAVTEAVSGFMVNLLQATVIVVVVLLLFMGLRSGIIIGSVLVITIFGTFVFMYPMGILLERISLGALIIALGMLVDNAIVVTEGMLVRMQRGEDANLAARQVVGQNALPLLAATVVAVLAFAAIGASNDSSGEFTRSLFQVITISLLLSWLTALTITPLMCAVLLPKGSTSAVEVDPYDSRFFRLYRRILVWCLGHRLYVVGSMGALLVLAVVGFGRVEQAFFPSSTRPQFMVDLWLAEGTSIHATSDRAWEVERLLRGFEGVTSVATFVGQGPPRYLLTVSSEGMNPAYAHFLVSVDDYRRISDLMHQVQRTLEAEVPDAIGQAYRFALGPGVANKIQIRVSGPDSAVLRSIADKVMDVFHRDGHFIGIQHDWRDRVLDYRPIIRDAQARQLGIEPTAVAGLLKETFEGRPIGVFREGNNTVPIILRAPEAERTDLATMSKLTLRSPVTGALVPFNQIVERYDLQPADSIIKRRNRTPTITVRCNPRDEAPSRALARVLPEIRSVQVPPGYAITIGGEYEDSAKAKSAILQKAILAGIAMIVIVILLFNALRQPLIIMLCVPLAIIGVTLGLLVTGQPFGFMALLGLLSLSGMLIKNAIVLVDEIDLQIAGGMEKLEAIVTSGVSRMRPVIMAAATTVLGMVPLLLDAFFVSMAVTIMAGLVFATILTLIVVPVLYAMFFNAPLPPASSKPTKPPEAEEPASSTNA